MPGRQGKAAEAVEAVAEAVGELTDAVEGVPSEPPPPGGPKKPSRGILAILRAWGPLAGTALTALGALLKTFDHSVTQNAYETLKASYTQLALEQQKTNADVARIQGWLDGEAHALELPAPAVPQAVDAGAPAGLRSITHPPLHPRPTGSGTGAGAAKPAPPAAAVNLFDTDGLEKPPPVPSVHTPAKLDVLPTFDKVERGDKVPAAD